MELIISILPIILVLVGIVVFKKPARDVALITMIITVVMGMVLFNLPLNQIVSDGVNGFENALYIAVIIFGAFTLLNLMRVSGALDKINNSLLTITNDKRALIIVIAFGFGTFLEGAAGGGSPAAIVTPFLVGLGFEPMVAITAALLSNGLSGAFGGAGNPVASGIVPIADYITVQEASVASGMILPILGLIFPFLLIFILYGQEGLKGIKGFLLTIGLTFSITMFTISNFVGPELVALLSGLLVMIVSVGYLKFVKIDTVEQFVYAAPKRDKREKWEDYTVLQAFSPYIFVLILLPLVRFAIPMDILGRYGYGTWVGTVIFICAILGTIVLKEIQKLGEIIKTAFIGVIPAFLTMVALLIVSNIMQSSGMMFNIANALANTGVFYPFVAVLIGSLGSFMTGTAAGANIMFAPLHLQTAQLLDMNIALLFGANNTGSSLGNAICPNNIVAVSTVVGYKNKEGEILRRVLKGWAILVVLGGLLALVYSRV